MKEEIEESEEELFKINNQLIKLWQDVKINNDEYALQHSDLIKKHAILLASEAIQVAAMAQKFQDSYKE